MKSDRVTLCASLLLPFLIFIFLPCLSNADQLDNHYAHEDEGSYCYVPVPSMAGIEGENY